MQAIKKDWWSPKKRKGESAPIEFELRPIDQRTLYEVQLDIRPRGIGFDGARAAFDYCVTGWRGDAVKDKPFSETAKQEILNAAEGDPMWSIWIATVAAEVYRRTFVKEDDLKNS